jgi:hypothetical protein
MMHTASMVLIVYLYSVEFIEGIKGAYEAIIELCYPNQEEDIFL